MMECEEDDDAEEQARAAQRRRAAQRKSAAATSSGPSWRTSHKGLGEAKQTIMPGGTTYPEMYPDTCGGRCADAQARYFQNLGVALPKAEIWSMKTFDTLMTPKI